MCLWQLASDDFTAISISRVGGRTKLQALEHIGGDQKPDFGIGVIMTIANKRMYQWQGPVAVTDQPTNKRRKNLRVGISQIKDTRRVNTTKIVSHHYHSDMKRNH